MTINVLTPRIVWTGNGSTGSLSLTADGQALPFTTTSQIVVQQLNTASLEVTTLVEGIDYSISGYPVTASGPAATLTRTAGVLASGYEWLVLRVTPASQTLDLASGGDFASSDIENSLDRLVILIQELKELYDRAVTITAFAREAGASPALPSPSALGYLRWNAAETALETAASVDLTETVVSVFVETLLDDADAAAFRTTLDLAASAFIRASVLPAASAAALRTAIGLAIGTNVQAFATALAAIGALTPAADRLPYFTGASTGALATFTAFGRSLAAAADAAAGRTALGGVLADGVFPGALVATIQDLKAQNTAGGTFTSGADQTRILNTLVYNRNTAVALASNQITIPAGTWVIRWSAPAYTCAAHQSWLHDITGGAVAARGTTEFTPTTVGVMTRSVGLASVTLAAPNVYEIRHRCQTTRATDGFGSAANFGAEIYTEVAVFAG